MAGRGVKAKAHENLSDANIEKVIGLLEANPPIKKTEACSILNIAYNTTRLGKIIDEYKAKKEESAQRRKANRGKPASNYEITMCIEGYLDGKPISEISDRLFRSPGFVKEIIDRIGVPEKTVGNDKTYWQPGLVPEQCVQESFGIGEVVWNTKRNAMCIIREERPAKDKTSKYYQVWVIEPIEEPSPYFPQYQDYGGYYDGAYAYDLAGLDHLKQYGVDVYKPYRSTFSKWLKP